MKIINRLTVILITFLFGYNSVYSQTQADVKMGEILNSGDLFQLRKEYPNLKELERPEQIVPDAAFHPEKGRISYEK